jgi:hypothetical protein
MSNNLYEGILDIGVGIWGRSTYNNSIGIPKLLLESGDNLLLESGDLILLEA